MLTEYSIPLILSSNPANGAQNVTQQGSEFTVQLNNPIAIPPGAINCTLEVNSATLVWIMPNISATLENDIFDFIHLATPYQIVIPNGLYSLSDLSLLFSREFVALGLASDLINFTANNATQQVVVTFPYIGTQCDFASSPESVRTVLGFDAVLVPAAPSTANESATSTNRAVFNSITNFLLSCDLVEDGIPTNSTGRNVVADIDINVAPGSVLNYRPRNPVQAPARGLIGHIRNIINVRLTDQDGRPVDTFGEFYSVLIVLKYTVFEKPRLPDGSNYD